MDSLDSVGAVIVPGAVVKLKKNAVYYDGRSIPEWVRTDRWVVFSVNGDCIVLGQNVSGTKNIKSPVNIKYLKLVEGKQPGRRKKPKKPTEQGNMRVSSKGTELIARYEGCRLVAYTCAAGVWTIGYGHTAGVKPGDRLPSEAAAKKLLTEDLKEYGDYVNECVKKGQIRFPLTQNMFDALTSFCYNCGSKNLQNLVTGRDAATVAEKMLLYDKGGGRQIAGLTERRKEERQLFLM